MERNRSDVTSSSLAHWPPYKNTQWCFYCQITHVLSSFSYYTSTHLNCTCHVIDTWSRALPHHHPTQNQHFVTRHPMHRLETKMIHTSFPHNTTRFYGAPNWLVLCNQHAVCTVAQNSRLIKLKLDVEGKNRCAQI